MLKRILSGAACAMALSGVIFTTSSVLNPSPAIAGSAQHVLVQDVNTGAQAASANRFLTIKERSGNPAVSSAGTPSESPSSSVSASPTSTPTSTPSPTVSSAPGSSVNGVSCGSSGSCDGSGKAAPAFRIRKLTKYKQAWYLLRTNRRVEYSCLNSIIMTESGWNVHAYNPSGAYGIPQALPGGKMAEMIYNVNKAGNRSGGRYYGRRWGNSAYVQLFWMVRTYIPSRYGTMCDAWAFHKSHGWY